MEESKVTREQNKAKLLSLMAEHNISRIEAFFDGSGDDGQIEDITFFNLEGKPIQEDFSLISCEVIHTNSVWSAEGRTFVTNVRQENFRELAEYCCWTPLEQAFSGWEINEGSFGTITFENDGTGTIDISERIIETEDSSVEF